MRILGKTAGIGALAALFGLTAARAETAAAPTFDPPGGTYIGPQTVTLSTTPPEASIRYTTDGSAPAKTTGTLYSGPIAVSASMTIKAIAYGDGVEDSAVSEAAYVIQPPPPVISSLSPASGVAGRPVVIAGSGFGESQGDSAVAFSGVIARIHTWSDVQIETLVPFGASSGGVVVTVNGVASAGAPFTVASPPAISAVSPASGAAGVQVTVSGSGFGTAQGDGGLWLGSAYGTIVQWSDTEIVATVASYSQSGTVRVKQNQVWSNALPFNVSAAAISIVAPTSGVPGTEVTITGSGFGAAQGDGQVWLGAANGAVLSWSDTQIVAQVVAGAGSGKAQVLQNGVWSNSVPFEVDSLHIRTVSPASGAPGTSVTILGGGFGAAQGSGAILLGSVEGQVLSWTDTEIVATVAPGAVTGVARVRQNGVWSGSKAFSVPAADGSVQILEPNMITMEVGETHQVQAITPQGTKIQGLTWTSSDPNVVALSGDDPPVLTALAPGEAIITAGGGSTHVIVSADPLPTGTVLWSNPGINPAAQPLRSPLWESNRSRLGRSRAKRTALRSFSTGAGEVEFKAAVPSPNSNVDLFAIGDWGRTVQAITSEGVTAWTASVEYGGIFAPDFDGGLVYIDSAYEPGLHRFDGRTGTRQTLYASMEDVLMDLAIHPNGTAFVVALTDSEYFVRGVDTATGDLKFSVPLPTESNVLSDILVAGDGNAYLAYETGQFVRRLMLLKVDAEGGSSSIRVVQRTVLEQGCGGGFSAGLITNADQGVLTTWSWYEPLCEAQPYLLPEEFGASLATEGGVSQGNGLMVAGQIGAVEPMLQREDGAFVGVAIEFDEGAYEYVPHMVAFGPGGGVLWSVRGLEPLMATADGGIIAKTEDGSVVAVGGNGSIAQHDGVFVPSWKGNVYRPGSIERVVTNKVQLAMSLWAARGGNPSGNSSASRSWVFILTWMNTFNLYPSNPMTRENMAVDATSTAAMIKSSALRALKKAYEAWPVYVREGTAGTGDNRASIEDGNSFDPNGGERCGGTFEVNQHDSTIWYDKHMREAQWALPIVLETPADVQAALGRLDLIRAIGTGIGNTAAHEIAHQFLGKQAEMDDYSINTYNGQGCGGDTARWWYGFGPVVWAPTTKTALDSMLKKGWERRGGQ